VKWTVSCGSTDSQLMPRKGIPMGKNEKTGSRVGHIASQGLKNPGSLTKPQIRTLAASALTQRPDHKPAPTPTKKK
jgi:hypothetical protein